MGAVNCLFSPKTIWAYQNNNDSLFTNIIQSMYLTPWKMFFFAYFCNPLIKGAFNDYVDTILPFLTTTYLYMDIFNPEGVQK